MGHPSTEPVLAVVPAQEDCVLPLPQALTQPLTVHCDPETGTYVVFGHLVPNLDATGETREAAIEAYLVDLYAHLADVCRQFPEVFLASKARQVDAESSALARLVSLRKKIQPMSYEPVVGEVKHVEDAVAVT